MNHPPIVLFDFDGVIITQRALEYTASTFLKKGFYKWRNIEKLRLIDFARMFEEADSKNKIKALIKIIKVYKEFIPSLWKRILFFIRFRSTYPKYEKYETLNYGLEEILIKFRENDFILGIVSNTSKNRLERFTRKFDLTKYFSVIISRDDSPYRKPNPYPIYIAIKLIEKRFNLSVDDAQVYYVGDLPQDIQCANNAKVNSIALLSGHGTKESLEISNPSFLVKHIRDILEIEPFKKFLFD